MKSSQVVNSPSSGREETETAYIKHPWKLYLAFRNAKIVTVEPAIFLFMFANFLFMSLYQQYYYARYGQQVLKNTSFPFPNGTFCLNSSEVDEYAGNGTFKVVETLSDHLVLYGQLANRIPSIFATILIGPLSDRYGRRSIIITAGVGRTLLSALALVIVYFNLNPYYFILANFLSGLTGDFPAVVAGTSSYLADVSSPRMKSLRIGIASGVISVGGLVGTLSIGYWLRATNCDFLSPMWAVLASNAFIIVYVLLFLPESLTLEERKELVKRNPKGIKALAQGIRIFTGFVPSYSVWRLWFSMTVPCFLLTAYTGWEYVNVYFLKAPPFDLGPVMIGIYQAVCFASRILACSLLLAVLVAIGTPDTVIALIGVASNAVTNLLTGFSRRLYQILAIGASIHGVDSVTWGGIRGYMSNLVAPEDQGALFAMIASLEAIFNLIGSVIWPILYPLTLQENLSSGSVWFFIAAITALDLPFILILVIFQKKNNALQPEKTPLLGYSVNSKQAS